MLQLRRLRDCQLDQRAGSQAGKNREEVIWMTFFEHEVLVYSKAKKETALVHEYPFKVPVLKDSLEDRAGQAVDC